ncbi:MAG: YdiU family protein [Proteobacteria bacterium]|nr:YdiU family protein [Desulfobacula sp.]MBU3952920.1 YdiU family protein [Pseudomonadota bacterium]
MTPKRTTLENLTFDNRFTRQLPCDKTTENTRRQVNHACYSRVNPTPVKAPALVAFSREAALLLDLEDTACRSDLFTRVFTGNHLLPGMDPFAMCYGGHQFGNWAGQLGDGRAILLGEVLNRQKDRWMLQLKGAGPTPYSRTADGLAVLRSSIREFLCSEAMFHLGVPTTRALSLTLTGEKVERDMFYDGHPRLESGAVVCRISPSFTRFGNFQILAARQENDLLKNLMDYTIETDFAHLGPLSRTSYERWFRDVCEKTMDMIVHWMRVGFVHGVMNTDNMSILGLTIDYGPYGWLEDYTPGWTPNTTDASGRRYSFKNQPQIALWNLGQLANALLPVVGHPEPLQEALDGAIQYFHRRQESMMAQKLGFKQFEPKTDRTLTAELLNILESAETDYTLFFRELSRLDITQKSKKTPFPAFMEKAFYAPDQITPAHSGRFNTWMAAYGERLARDRISHKKKKQQMDRVNPKYVLRNYLAQTAIDKAEKKDFSGVWELLDVMRRPYDEQPDKESFAAKRPEWARHKPGCSMLSCSS